MTVLPYLQSQIQISEEIGAKTANGAYDASQYHDVKAERGD